VLEGYRFASRFRVPLSDVDILRHANNVAYLRWAETLRTDYAAEVLGADVGGEHGMILAKTKVVYEKPILYRERVAIGTRIPRIGGKSFDFEFEVWSDDKDVRCAHIYSVLVAMNYVTNQTIPVPQDWRDRIVEFER